MSMRPLAPTLLPFTRWLLVTSSGSMSKLGKQAPGASPWSAAAMFEVRQMTGLLFFLEDPGVRLVTGRRENVARCLNEDSWQLILSRCRSAAQDLRSRESQDGEAAVAGWVRSVSLPSCAVDGQEVAGGAAAELCNDGEHVKSEVIFQGLGFAQQPLDNSASRPKPTPKNLAGSAARKRPAPDQHEPRDILAPQPARRKKVRRAVSRLVNREPGTCKDTSDPAGQPCPEDATPRAVWDSEEEPPARFPAQPARNSGWDWKR